mgnify:CR=1 FL=1
MKDINWAVLGTGVIANEMAVALKKNGKNIAGPMRPDQIEQSVDGVFLYHKIAPFLE